MANVLDKSDRSVATIKGTTVIKAEQYKWARPTSPGRQMEIRKELLNIDDSYQRFNIVQEDVMRIVRNWDWTLFGVLSVAERDDASYWVFDGGHRTRASFYHQEVVNLPCIVFKMSDLSEEARAFYAAAKIRSTISSLDAHRAATVAGEPNAVATSRLLAEMGIEVAMTAVHKNQLKCIATVQDAVAANPELARGVLAICLKIAGEDAIRSAVFRGLFLLADHFKDRDIIREFASTLESLSQAEIDKAIREFKAESGKGGGHMEAKAILKLLNKNKRTRKLDW